MIPLLALASLACSTAPSLPPPGPAPAFQQEDEPAATPARVKAALDAGDYERAHALLTALLLEQRLARVAEHRAAGAPEAAWKALQEALELAPRSPRARALRGELGALVLDQRVERARGLLLEARPRDAMVALDEALALSLEDARVQFLRGECWLRMGLEDGDPNAFDDALASFLAAGGLPEAASGAARALHLAWFASGEAAQLERALELARRGRAAAPEESAWGAVMSSPPLRTLGEIAFELYRADKLADAPAEQVGARFEECRAALEAAIGRAPEDPWAWRQLANLLGWEARHDEARALLLRALEMAPLDTSLHEGLVAACDALGGAEETIATYAEWVAAHPDVGLGPWWLGAKRLEQAVAKLRAGETGVLEELAAAEADFARCAELAPDYRQSCDGYRALCRSALGRAHIERGELEAARAALLSMEDCLEGGLLWQYPGLWDEPGPPETGVFGLQKLVARYMRTAADGGLAEEQRNAALESAAGVAVYLHEYLPEDPDRANDAGFLCRDAGVALEQRAELLLRRSAGLSESAAELPQAERDAARAEAQELLRRAAAHMERSYAAYSAAARLAPGDPRIVNDAALILVYYLQRELDTAEGLLQRAIEVGTARLEAGDLEPERREALTEALGDAHENMGTLLFTLRGEAAAAIPWFEQSLAIGPFPRPIVERRHLPLCRAVLEGRVDVGTVQRAAYWGALERERVLERIQADDELRRLLR